MKHIYQENKNVFHGYLITCLFLIVIVLLSARVVWAQTGDAIYIDESGNVGVGTNAPTAKLDVNGVIKGFGTVPIGGIIMWSGLTPPEGWALCDGGVHEGFTTPDLSGRFTVGYSKHEYDNPGNLSEKGKYPGKKGGEAVVALNKKHMPKHDHGKNTKTDGNHNHNIYMADKDGESNRQYVSEGRKHKKNNWRVSRPIISAGKHQHVIEPSGEGQAHENRPPYYVLAFIMRVK